MGGLHVPPTPASASSPPGQGRCRWTWGRRGPSSSVTGVFIKREVGTQAAALRKGDMETRETAGGRLWAPLWAGRTRHPVSGAALPRMLRPEEGQAAAVGQRTRRAGGGSGRWARGLGVPTPRQGGRGGGREASAASVVWGRGALGKGQPDGISLSEVRQPEIDKHHMTPLTWNLTKQNNRANTDSDTENVLVATGGEGVWGLGDTEEGITGTDLQLQNN